MSSVVMAGALQNFDVPSILQAVSLSRQYTLIRLWDRQHHETGEIRLKAGQLVDAAYGSDRGRGAFASILRSASHHSFRVERLSDPVNLPEPLGTLAGLLLNMPPRPQPQPVVSRGVPKRLRPNAPKSSAPTKVAIPKSVKKPVDALQVIPAPSEIAEIVARIEPLAELLLARLPDCRVCSTWSRGQAPVEPQALANYVGMIVTASTSLAAAAPDGISASVETSRGTLMLRDVTQTYVAAFVFNPGTPHGLMRMAVADLGQPLAALLSEEDTSQHTDTVRSG